MRPLTFSRGFPSYHLKAGQPTYFVEKIWESIYLMHPNWLADQEYLRHNFSLGLNNMFTPKHHTIRKGHRWKAGDWFRPVVWGENINPKSGRKGPYQSKQITIGPDMQVKKTYPFLITKEDYHLNGFALNYDNLKVVAGNDGLEVDDFESWFNVKEFDGQVIVWNETIDY